MSFFLLHQFFEWKNSIILLDRGFGYFSTCEVILSGNSGFCIRLKASQSNFAKKVLLNPLSDFITEWCVSEEERSTCKRNKVDSESFRVRVTKVILKNGETEILVSTLFDTALINEKAIQELYHLRWGVEEGFKKLKPKMKLEQFGCRRYEGIYQEFYSHIFMIELIASDAGEEITKKTQERKLKYKYSWQNAFRHLRNKFIDIFHLGEFISSLEYLIEKISGSLIAIKENRMFGRNSNRDKSRSTQCYK
jgi:hypothetical protein